MEDLEWGIGEGKWRMENETRKEAENGKSIFFISSFRFTVYNED